MSVKMVAWTGNGKTQPPLWDVMIEGVNLGGGRVLKMGRRYIPVSDAIDFLPFTFESRRECAEYVADELVKFYREKAKVAK